MTSAPSPGESAGSCTAGAPPLVKVWKWAPYYVALVDGGARVIAPVSPFYETRDEALAELHRLRSSGRANLRLVQDRLERLLELET